MFYSYDLLCIRRGGRYSVIWYTATHRRYPRKEDIKKVNIANTWAMDTERIPGDERQPEEQRKRASRRKSKAPPEVPLERLLEMTLQPPPLPEAMDEAAMRMRLETTEAAYTSKD
ncbi:Protein of unknown function, partial [Gryllus bimaculatus]